MKYQKGFTLAEMLGVVIALLAAAGYIANIYKLVQIVSDPVTGMLILRAVGIFAFPIGMVLGYM